MKKKRASRFNAGCTLVGLTLLASSAFAFSPRPDQGNNLDQRIAEVSQRCAASNMLAVDPDPAAKGPWAVGSRTATISGLTTEIYYPAAAGSEVGKAIKTYDVRQFFPAEEAAKLPAEVAIRPCETCVDGLPIDEAHGPYPVIVYVHGTAANRIASLPLFEHWASRGFVVVSADNPNIYQKDLMESSLRILRANQKGDTRQLLAAIRNPYRIEATSFLNGYIDPERIGLGGHSAGGVAINDLGSEDGVRVLIPMASGGTEAGSELISTMVLGGLADSTANFNTSTRAYNSSPVKKRLVGIADMGHVGFVNICRGVELQKQFGLELDPLMERLLADGCGEEFIAPEVGWEMINYASTAAYEETLMCSDSSAEKLRMFKTLFGNQNVYQESL